LIWDGIKIGGAGFDHMIDKVRIFRKYDNRQWFYSWGYDDFQFKNSDIYISFCWRSIEFFRLQKPCFFMIMFDSDLSGSHDKNLRKV